MTLTPSQREEGERGREEEPYRSVSHIVVKRSSNICAIRQSLNCRDHFRAGAIDNIDFNFGQAGSYLAYQIRDLAVKGVVATSRNDDKKGYFPGRPINGETGGGHSALVRETCREEG